MISFSSQRGLGQDLATHLMNTHDNELMEVAEVRGAVAQDLHGAFAEWEFQAHSLTKCQKYLYSMSVNPDPNQDPLTREQYTDFITRTEEKLGLAGQPRAIVFHEKYEREHCHVVWSRIDQSQEKAVQLSFDREKLMAVTRDFAKDHGIELPKGYERDGGKGKGEEGKSQQISLYEQAQKNTTGVSKEDHKRLVTEAWDMSDGAKAFVHALAERGYVLATGDRPYVVVDIYGNMNSLPKLIDDKNIKTADLKKFFAKDFPQKYLPDVEEAKKLLKEHLAAFEKGRKPDLLEEELEQLKTRHQHRRKGLEQDKAALKEKQKKARLQLANTQRAEREKHRTAYLTERKQTKQHREKESKYRLTKILSKASGYDYVTKQVHKLQDRKRLKTHLQEKQKMSRAQKFERQKMKMRQISQMRELARQDRALQKVEAREMNSLQAELTKDMRVNNRDRYFSTRENIAMHVLEIVLKNKSQHKNQELKSQLEASFKEASKNKKRGKAISLKDQFEQAARDDEDTGKGDEDSTTSKSAQPKLDLEAMPVPKKKSRRRRKRRDRNPRGQDRGRDR
ncbi:MAG: relaxase [Candidatus Pacearchaeota archaeon]|nr:relaxase [Candidatus Pacearchaeota archaeon]